MSWNTFASQLIPVVGLAAAIYIAIYVLKNVGSFTKQNAADFLTGDKKGLLLLMFKTTVIISLLKDTWLIDNIISPVMQAGLNIGAKLSVTGATMATSSGSGYDAIFKMVNESVKQFNDQVYETIAIGNAMICNATRDFIFSWYWLMLTYGLILFVFGWILLAFPFILSISLSDWHSVQFCSRLALPAPFPTRLSAIQKTSGIFF